jgi:hypothetical protein
MSWLLLISFALLVYAVIQGSLSVFGVWGAAGCPDWAAACAVS